ncbi:MAG: ferredoxin [Gemmatimonadetes bacterium]|nr:ferredoxin [Gemmatimonadota bacterium]
MDAPRITVDHTRCVGNAQCVTLAPAVFRHNEAVQSEVVDPSAAPLELILKAARFCPTSAIRVESASGAVLFPAS